MAESVQPTESWQQSWMDGKSEAKKTLRDEFAIAALQGLLASCVEQVPLYDEGLVKYAYGYADAMLKEREKDDGVSK